MSKVKEEKKALKTTIDNQKQELELKDKKLNEQNSMLEQKDQMLGERDQMIRSLVQTLLQAGKSIAEIATITNMSEERVKFLFYLEY